MQYLVVGLQIFNATFAFLASESQTRRIIKNTNRQNLINSVIMALGGIMAAGGTFIIWKRVKKGTQQIEDNNRILKSKLR